jgi:hypothetical protein
MLERGHATRVDLAQLATFDIELGPCGQCAIT